MGKASGELCQLHVQLGQALLASIIQCGPFPLKVLQGLLQKAPACCIQLLCFAALGEGFEARECRRRKGNARKEGANRRLHLIVGLPELGGRRHSLEMTDQGHGPTQVLGHILERFENIRVAGLAAFLLQGL